MTQYRNTFEGGTAGVALSTSNLGGASGNQPTTIVASNGSAMTFDTTHVAHGSMAVKMVNSSTGAAYLSYGGLTATGMASRFYFYFTSLPTADEYVIRHYGSTANVARLEFDGVGAMRILDSTGTVVTGSTSPSTPPLNTWVRFDFFTDTVGGQVKAAYSTLDAAATWDSGLLAATLGANPATRSDFGKVTGVYATDTWMDDPVVDDAATGYIAPGVPINVSLTLVPTSGTVGTNASTTATATATGGTGTPYTYTFDFGDGTAPVGPQSSNTVAHTYTTAGVVTAGVTAPYTVTVTVGNS
jgi:hypothetical protein